MGAFTAPIYTFEMVKLSHNITLILGFARDVCVFRNVSVSSFKKYSSKDPNPFISADISKFFIFKL